MADQYIYASTEDYLILHSFAFQVILAFIYLDKYIFPISEPYMYRKHLMDFNIERQTPTVIQLDIETIPLN